MKNKIVLYLLLFSVLIILFMYVNQKRIYEKQETIIENLTEKNTSLEKIKDSLDNQISDLQYFTFLGNENAMTYYENQGFEANAIQNVVFENIYAQNTLKEGHPLIPFVGMEGVMKINKVKFLNHRWVIADFTDGRYWGEMILEYDLDKNKDLTLKTLSSLLYPFN